MSLTLQQLKKIMPNARHAADALPIINAVAAQYEINNERRMAAWLATLAVESGELKYQEEIATGAAYEGRSDLGNTQKGDGRRFKGHGRIQITGRDNHKRYTNYLKASKHLPFVDFIAEPKRLAEEPYATDSAGWFWAKYRKLNAFADKGDFLTTQIRVNGRNKKTGLPNHYDVRQRYYTRALSVLPDNFSAVVASQPSDGNVSDVPLESASNSNAQPPINSEGLPASTETLATEKTVDSEGNITETVLSKAESVGDKFQSFQGVLDKFGFSIDGAKRSVGTIVLTGFKALMTPALIIGGVLLNHWELFVIAGLIAVLVYLLWDRSGKRVAEAKAGMPVEVAKAIVENGKT